MDLALDGLQRLVCHKAKPNQTIWFHQIDTKRIEKNLDGDFTRMIQAILNKTAAVRTPTSHL